MQHRSVSNATDRWRRREGAGRFAAKPRLEAAGRRYTISQEALLVGHEDWVQSVVWQPLARGAHADPAGRTLLTASMDRTMMLWRRDPGSGGY